MANDGKGSISASILYDEIKTRITGSLNYVPYDTTEKWIYKRHDVPASPTVLFTTDDEYSANIAASDSVANADQILWIAIKHSGYSDVNKSKTKEGIMLNFTGTSPAFDGANDTSNNNIIIGPNELFICKLNKVLVEDLKAGTCILTNGRPTAQGASTVHTYVAAIIDDV